ncbi:MAG: hypothetical protein KGH75_04885 [Rhodospirillales bacterium]|nr:hypothetical protein [Rhodospirillales bacterium]
MAKIASMDMTELAKEKYVSYSVEVNEDRAIQCCYDGLKPVQRRILWSMFKLGLNHKAKLLKAAKVYGSVLGDYHPHGDCLEGETLVYLLNGKTIPIKDLVGQGKKWVIAYDKETKAYVPALAHSWRVGQNTKKTYLLHLSDGSKIEVTKNHPFKIKNKGWVKAEDLELGDMFMNAFISNQDYPVIRSNWPKTASSLHSLVGTFHHGGIDSDSVLRYVGGTLEKYLVLDTNSPVFLDFIQKARPYEVVFLENIEILEHDSKKPMYDFTVDKYENMLICTKQSEQGNHLVVAHNSSIYSAMITMVSKVPVPMIFGSGNWGSFLGDKAAAGRYTECKLSKYSDVVFFDPFYNPVVKTVLNYNSDPDYPEPVALNALIPNALVNSVGGIGVGVAVDMPLFTVDSVIKTIEKSLEAGKCTPKMCEKYLKFTNKLNGIPTSSFEETLNLFKTGKGKIQFTTQYSIDSKKRQIVLSSRFADVNMASAIEKTLNDPHVKICSDVPNKKEKTFEIHIELKSSVNSDHVQKVAKSIVDKYFSNTESYEVTTTSRDTKDNEVADKKLYAATTPMIINDWIKFRLDLEQRACQYWIDKAQKEIDYRLLLIKAVDNLEIIIEALRKRFTKDELKEFIAKKMKISLEQSDVIINLKIYQLRKLEKEQLLQEIKDRKETISGYKVRIQKPAEYVITHVNEIGKKLKSIT